MLLNFPEDYKSERHIPNAISSFGRTILWEESDSYPGRVMIRARIMSVEAVPQFIVYTDPINADGDSWTIQCEVMQHHMVLEPPEEDPLPNEPELEAQIPFDFFGLGQPVPQQNQNEEHEQNEEQNQQQIQGNKEQGQQQEQIDQNQMQMQLQQANPWEP
jgi:hypothetical protein